MKNLPKEALWAVLAATWITGHVHQFGSWSMTAVYVAISLMMVAVTFSDRLVLKFVPRRMLPDIFSASLMVSEISHRLRRIQNGLSMKA